MRAVWVSAQAARVTAAALVLFIAACGPEGAVGTTGEGPAAPDAEVAAPAGEDPDARATVAFVGDVLPHGPVVESALVSDRDGYDFAPVFAPVAPFVGDADLAVANLETCLAGSAVGYQSYPRFNAPDEVAAGLAEAGFDGVGTANNHALDMGYRGLVRTLDVLDGAGLGHTGTARTAAEASAPLAVDIGNVRVALLGYTGSTNGISPPPGRPWAVSVLDPVAVARDAGRARSDGADIVVALVHWGDEYTRYPSAAQRELAPRLIDAGVDVVVGAGPHMVQPMEVVRGSAGREGFVAWSLGNFVSAQRLRFEDSGVVLFLDVAEQGDGARILGVRYLPVYVQKTVRGGERAYRVLPALPALIEGGGLELTDGDRRRMHQIYGEITVHLAGAAGVSTYEPR